MLSIRAARAVGIIGRSTSNNAVNSQSFSRAASERTSISFQTKTLSTSVRAPLPPRPRIPPGGYKKTTTSSSSSSSESSSSSTSWWNSPEIWGGLGAIAGWGMSGAAIYDAINSGPEIISLRMTGVLLVYSSLFARWAFIVSPPNYLLAGCHVTNVAAQCNQLKRAIEHKLSVGEEEEVKEMTQKGGLVAGGTALLMMAGPTIQAGIVGAGLGPISAFAGAEAGPFTVHFWAPMSKWFISGASFMDLDRPTDKISIAQYTALTLTGFFFTRYSLLVKPVNYLLCSVNVALFGSSAWHLGRKINADYIQDK